MPRWIETELKLMLPDEAAWQRVRTVLGDGRVVFQVNHFFDRPDRVLRDARIGVRLRAEGGRYSLAVKGERAAPSEGAVSQRIELETRLTLADAETALTRGLDLSPWLDHWRAELSVGSTSAELVGFLDTLEAACRGRLLQRYAEFSNRRESLRLALHDADGRFEVELALDRTTLPGDQVDYEIEIEFAPDQAAGDAGDSAAPNALPSRVEAAVQRWLAGLGGIATIPATSKLARFHHQLEKHVTR